MTDSVILMKCVLSLIFVLLVVSCQRATPTFPFKVTVTPEMAVVVDSAKITTDRSSPEGTEYTMLRIFCEWIGSDPRDMYSIKRPILEGVNKDTADAQLAWYVPLPLDWAKHKGMPFELDFENPPGNFDHFTAAIPLGTQGSAIPAKTVVISFPLSFDN